MSIRAGCNELTNAGDRLHSIPYSKEFKPFSVLYCSVEHNLIHRRAYNIPTL